MCTYTALQSSLLSVLGFIAQHFTCAAVLSGVVIGYLLALFVTLPRAGVSA